MTVGQKGVVYEEWLELRNGCLCCSVKYACVLCPKGVCVGTPRGRHATSITDRLIIRDNGVAAIEKLMEKKGKFDYVLLETTGVFVAHMC